MVAKTKILLVLLLAIPIYGFGGQPDSSAWLSIRARPAMTVFVDSLSVGPGSVDSLALHPGWHTVSGREASSTSWGNRGVIDSVFLNPGQHQRIELNSTALLRVNSQPFDADVLVDGKRVGVTPLYLELSNPGAGTITVEKAGFGRTTVIPGPNGIPEQIKLTPLYPNLKPVVMRSEDRSNSVSWEREGLVLGSLISSWVSFYLKREADRYYDKYQRTTNPERLRSYADKTREYDRYSEIAIGVSITTLATYMYFLIWE
jgi:hypothetical protein